MITSYNKGLRLWCLTPIRITHIQDNNKKEKKNTTLSKQFQNPIEKSQKEAHIFPPLHI